MRTSKFEKLSATVFDSIKELNTNIDNDQVTRVNVTTDNDLLRAYSTNDDYEISKIKEEYVIFLYYVLFKKTRIFSP